MMQNNSCSKCGRTINKKGPLVKHEKSCSGINNEPSFKVCDVSLLLNDGRFKCLKCEQYFYKKNAFVSHYWLYHNEKGKQHLEKILETVEKCHKDKIGKPSWNKGLTKETDERIKKSAETIKLKLDNGLIKPSGLGRKLTDEHKEKLSFARSNILSKKGGGGYSTIGWYDYTQKDGSTCVLRGTWEVKVAEWLDLNNIKWTKDILLRYNKEDIKRTYIPDFFIPSLNIVLEVKGFFSLKDKEKMNLVIEQHKEINFVMLFEKEIKDLDNSLKFLLDRYKQTR